MKVTYYWTVCCSLLLATVGMPLPTHAQITPDGTLNTTVTQTGNNFTITNGTTQGTNLFHSFSQFSIPTGGSAFFNNATTIQNVFARVTGGSVSNVDGSLRANGTANLFLLNPAGILFGPNASLNLGGSFVATTANSIQFADGTEFSAKNLTGTPLLTISVPIGLQFGQTSASITNHANLSANQGLTLAADSVLSTAPLAAPNGTVRIQATTGDAQLQAIAARSVAIDAQEAVVVGAIDTQSATNNGGTVTIRAGKTMTVNGTINTASTANIGNAGDVTLKAGNDLTVQSINASVGSSSGSTQTNGNGGTISLESGGNLLVRSGATIETRNSRNQGIGQSGAVNITTRSMTLYGTILTNTRGKGDAGKITVQASDLVFLESKEGLPRAGFSTAVDRGAIGNANDIQITAQALKMGDVTQLLASTFGVGNAGRIDVQTEDTIALYGRANIFSNVESGAIGKSPGINLKTGSLTAEFIDFTKVPNIFSSLLGEGSSGNINIQVRNSLFLSGARIRSTIDGNGKGVGGNLNIWVGGDLYAKNNTLINTRSNSFGKAGNIDIHADSITLDGALPAEGFPTTVNTSTRSAYNGGQITITSRTLSLLNGAILTTNTLNSGNAGDVTINASESVRLDGLEKTDASFFGAGKRNNKINLSAIQSDVEGAATTGNGGNITIQTPLLTVSNGGYISSSTGGLGNAGNITITTNVAKFEGIGSPPIPNGIPTSSVKLDFSSGAFSLATGNGNGGNINIQAAESLSIARGAQLSVSSKGQGSAGNIMLQTDQLRLQDGILNAESAAGGQGNIYIDSNLLLMRQGSQITATAGGNGNGGNITINSPIILGLENSDIIANAFKGRGGNIQITTQGIIGLKYRNQLTPENDITASSQFGVSGNVQINNIGVDPNAGLVALPANVADASQQVATGCTGSQGSSFIATGRGGVPQNPTQQLMGDRTWNDLRDLSAYRQPGHPAVASTPAVAPVLLQATTWQRNPDGTAELIAHQPSTTLSSFATCSGSVATTAAFGQ